MKHIHKRLFGLFITEGAIDFHIHVSKYKMFEIEIEAKYPFKWENVYTPFSIRLDSGVHEDHGGIDFDFIILDNWLTIRLRDGRHWNYDAKRYYLDGEKEE